MSGRRWSFAVRRVVLAVLLGGVLGMGLGAGQPVVAGPPGRDLPFWVDVPQQVFFEETGHTLADPFLYYWRGNGERLVFGLPISEPITSANGKMVTQYFERAVLEYRPNSGGAIELVVGYGAVTNSSVNLRIGPGIEWAKVGVLETSQQVRLVGGPLPDADGAPWYQVTGVFGTGWAKGEFLERHDDSFAVRTLAVAADHPRQSEPAFQPLSPIVRGAIGPDREDLLVFPTTGHTLSGGFKRFWEAHSGPTLLGLPLSEPFTEISPDDGQPYLTQYFERAKMEVHPTAANPDGEVELAALGRHAAIVARVPMTPVPRPSDVPVYSPDLFTAQKWIEVNLTEQRLTAWDGDLPILTTLIRSGKDGWQTPTGTFQVFRKVELEDMTLGRPDDPDYYYTPDVPWVMYFLEGGFAIHGAVLDDLWGTRTSHGCVNTPADLAAYLYQWAPIGTLVWIHD